MVVSAGVLVFGTGSQAAPTAKAPQAAVALAPGYWSDYGQTIVNYNSNKCLQPQSYAAQAFIEQRTCDGSSLQRWKLSDPGTGYAVLVNQGSGLCIDLYANSEDEVGNGILLEQFYCNVAYTGQQWARSWGSRRYHYQVQNRIKGLCLDVRNRWEATVPCCRCGPARTTRPRSSSGSRTRDAPADDVQIPAPSTSAFGHRGTPHGPTVWPWGMLASSSLPICAPT